MALTPLQASTTCLFHADTDFQENSARRATGAQGSGSASVTLSSAQSKFGAKSLYVYNVNPAGLNFGGAGPLQANVSLSMECWAYFSAHRTDAFGNARLIGSRVPKSGSSSGSAGLRTTSAGVLEGEYYDGGNNANRIAIASPLPTGQWVHLAYTVAGSNSTRRIYVNGVVSACASGTSFSFSGQLGNDFTIGGWPEAGYYPPNAYVDEVRFVSGMSPFEADVEPPTTAHADAQAGDSLLLHGEGSNGGTTITDSSSNGLTPTQIGSSGNVTTSTVKFKFGSASLRFGGTHAISYASSALFEASSRDWVIEATVSLDTGLTTGFRHIWQLFGASTNFRVNLCYDVPNNRMQFYTENGSGTGGARITSGALTPGSWHHVALVKEGSSFTLRVDGVVVGGCYAPTMPTGNLGLCVGTQNFSPAASDYWVGYIEEFRATFGSTRYGLNFMPPTSHYADVPAIDGASKVPQIASRAGVSVATTLKAVPQAAQIKDVYFGGRGRITGTVKEKGTPSIPRRERVWLLREKDAYVIRELWSNQITGAYSFENIDETLRYSVLTYDHNKSYRAVIADNIQPDVS